MRSFRLLDLSGGSQPGRAVTVAPGARAEILDVRATDGANPELVTIQCSAQVPDAAARGALFPVPVVAGPGFWFPSAYTILRWGVHGATHELVADLSAGWSATLCADFVRLSAVFDLVVPTRTGGGDPRGGPLDGPPLGVAASLAYGTRSGGSTGPRRTYYTELGRAGGETPRIPVPSWARGLCVLAPKPPGNSSTLSWWGGASAPNPIQVVSIDLLNIGAEWNAAIVPWGAQSVSLSSTDALGLVSLVWLLGV